MDILQEIEGMDIYLLDQLMKPLTKIKESWMRDAEQAEILSFF